MSRTVRQQIADLLAANEMTPRQLAQAIGLKEKELADHLNHLRRSLSTQGLKLRVRPAECPTCGFVFRERRRLASPGRCPECKATRLEPPAYRIE
jgi:predicted Zn-ribbon and HTH transcriptional regulator